MPMSGSRSYVSRHRNRRRRIKDAEDNEYQGQCGAGSWPTS